MMEHTTKDGRPKLVEKCSYPLTALGVVKRIYTNMAVLDVTQTGFNVVEMAPGVTREALVEATAAHLVFAN